MKLNEVQEVTSQLIAQVMGNEYMSQHGYLEGIPVDKLVDVGRDVLDSDRTTELATKSLVTLLSKREIEVGTFKSLYEDVIIDKVEWGGFIERVKIDYADIMDSPVLNLADKKDFSSIENAYYKPRVISKIYEEGNGITIPISITRKALTEAFNDYDSLNSFISAIQSKVRQTLKLAIDRYIESLIIASIAVSTKATNTAVYLLDEATNLVPGITESTTAEEAMNNSDFIRFVARRISEVRDNMCIPSTAFNNGNIAMASTENILYLLTDYVSHLKFDVLSNYFNNDELAFGKYVSIPTWQASKSDSNSFDFNTTSAIRIASDNSNKLGLGVDSIEIDNVVGVLLDRKAIGLTVRDEFTTTNYVACADFWNEFLHSITSQILDSDYPIVAFIVGRKNDI